MPPLRVFIGAIRSDVQGGRADVIVVGAGLAAERRFEIERAGRSAIVLEARDRVGGRTLNHSLGGGKVTEVGGTFIGPTQDRIAALATELGIGTFLSYDIGESVSLVEGRRGTYTSGDPATFLASPGGADVVKAIGLLDTMAKNVPVATPWTAPEAIDWDSQTADTWKRLSFDTSEGRTAIDVLAKQILGAEPRDVSLLYLTWYVAQAGNETTPGSLLRLISTTGGARRAASSVARSSSRSRWRGARARGQAPLAGPPHRPGSRRGDGRDRPGQLSWATGGGRHAAGPRGLDRLRAGAAAASLSAHAALPLGLVREGRGDL
jgi:monoamine oxidase